MAHLAMTVAAWALAGFICTIAVCVAAVFVRVTVWALFDK